MFALLLQLQIDVDRPGLGVALQLRVFWLDRVEVPELIQPQQAQFPQPVVEHLAFIQQQFAADDLVSRRGVPRKFNAPHEKLFLLIQHQRQIHYFLVVIHIEGRLCGEIDVSVLAIQLAERIERFADLIRVEDITLLQREIPSANSPA